MEDGQVTIEDDGPRVGDIVRSSEYPGCVFMLTAHQVGVEMWQAKRMDLHDSESWTLRGEGLTVVGSAEESHVPAGWRA